MAVELQVDKERIKRRETRDIWTGGNFKKWMEVTKLTHSLEKSRPNKCQKPCCMKWQNKEFVYANVQNEVIVKLSTSFGTILGRL